MGKEWYRFPSNFFLPSNNWNVKFIKSEFKGQLPQPYLTEKAHATATERPNFNNLNLEELDRYVKVKCPVCLCYEIVVLWSCRKKVVVSKNSSYSLSYTANRHFSDQKQWRPGTALGVTQRQPAFKAITWHAESRTTKSIPGLYSQAICNQISFEELFDVHLPLLLKGLRHCNYDFLIILEKANVIIHLHSRPKIDLAAGLSCTKDIFTQYSMKGLF